MPISTTNLGEIFHSSVIQNPTKIALIDGESGVEISFQQLEINTAKVRSILDSMNISKGDRIALFFSKSDRVPICTFWLNEGRGRARVYIH